MTLALRYAVRSDVGLLREGNEDSAYAGPRLLAVADGMGGHAAGDVASKVVIAALEHLDEDAPSGDLLQALRQAVFEGSEIAGLAPHKIINRGIGRTFQIPRPFRRLSIFENVALAGYYGQGGAGYTE